MRVVVTGATGNVGTSLIERLGHDDRVDSIVGIARREPAVRLPRTQFVAADVTSGDLPRLFAGADAVVHLAWLFQPTHDPLMTWRANVEGSIRVFQAAVAAGVRTLVHASSVGAYSPGVDDRPVDESWPTHSLPTAAYGREKAYVERVLDTVEARHRDLRVVRLRPVFIFKRSSATQQRRLFAGPLVPGPLLRPGRGRTLLLPYPPGLRFQALHTDDVAEAYRLALHRDVRGAFNVAADPVVDGDVLAELLGTRGLLVPKPIVRSVVAAAWHLHLVPADPTLFDLFLKLPLLDASRARDELGWRPRHTGLQAIVEMLDGMASGAGADTPPLAPDSATSRAREVMTRVGEEPH